MEKIQETNAFIREERAALLHHALYKRINSISDLKIFTEGHVYAVWDFMSLLKALQINLTCTQVPWFASPNPDVRYLINEIVLAEESDEYFDGRRLSHFEMYLDAMQHMGADVSEVLGFLKEVSAGNSIFEVIEKSSLDYRIKDFLSFSFSVIATGELHKIASAFTFGREDLIPDMFTSILTELKANFPEADLDRFIYYFQRHIDLDGDEHGPLAMKMIHYLGGDDAKKWQEIQEVAKEALVKRIALWDAIEARITGK
ncbi:DUF3050 domain-containing protein [Sphingobacterium sp. Mn56C]|uniref:DUF3050 domain-containing protein n=1 Tax=Sphingobacterium sp. Mn56C TaxID=3395261 RepID=UPI003BD6639E